MQLLDVGGDVGSLVQYMKALNFQSVGSAKSLVGRPGVGPPDTAHLLMKLEYRYPENTGTGSVILVHVGKQRKFG